VRRPSPLLLCFDGSPGAERAIAAAAELSPSHPAIVLTVWQPVGEFRAGNPVGAYLDAITPAAREREAAAVVAGSRGHSLLGAALLGSVSSALTHECPRPILIVPDPARR
jgi:nucleotide-binding universal stress UspA family protein